jgi:hypothetical protein
MKIQAFYFGSLSVSAYAQYGTADNDCDTDSDSEQLLLSFYFRNRWGLRLSGFVHPNCLSR